MICFAKDEYRDDFFQKIIMARGEKDVHRAVYKARLPYFFLYFLLIMSLKNSFILKTVIFFIFETFSDKNHAIKFIKIFNLKMLIIPFYNRLLHNIVV